MNQSRSCHTAFVNRRLRLALFLAALAAAGPVSPARVIDATRVAISIGWLDSDRIAAPRLHHSRDTVPAPAVARPGFHAHPAPDLPPALLPHSLFQRPPPPQL
jgi:hypothetical protein